MKAMIKPLIAAVIICVTLCACSGAGELGERYTVTALGFDFNKNITVTAEIFVTGDTAGSELERNVVSASGNDVSQAFYNLKLMLSQNPLLDHCTAVVIGNSLNGADLKDVFAFCKNQKGLNLGVNFASAQNAAEILSEKFYNVAVGFDIVSAIDSFEDTGGVDFKCRRYELEAALSSYQKIFTLPVFVKGQKGADIKYQRVFDGFDTVCIQNLKDTLVYSLLCNRNNSGTLYIDNEYANIKGYHTYMDIKKSGKKTVLELTTEYSADGHSKDFKNCLEDEVNLMLNNYRKKDIFGFLNRIEQKDKKLFDGLKSDYGTLFSSGMITVKYKAVEK